MRYSVCAVDLAGCTWEVASVGTPSLALEMLRAQQFVMKGKGTAYCVDDESGEVVDGQLEEMCL